MKSIFPCVFAVLCHLNNSSQSYTPIDSIFKLIISSSSAYIININREIKDQRIPAQHLATVPETSAVLNKLSTYRGVLLRPKII